ncbi:MAG: hypothetical protein VX514_07135 [Candidatus Thermoplasmatota archaeon]|nr:hypothetical protein [Candidatus Thermoplasmatota archaeon]
MSWRDELAKSEIRKSSRIRWEMNPRDVSVFLKNAPDGRDSGETVGRCIVEGAFEADIRTWGVKDVGSYATSVELDFEYLVYEEGTGDDKEIVPYEIKFDADKLDNDMPTSESALNPSDVTIYIDMKNQRDKEKFEISGDFEWQGSY